MMKRILFIIAFAVSFTGLAQTDSELLDRQVFLDSIKKSDVQLADLRTPEENATEGAFPHALNVDFLMGEDFYKEMEATFDKSKPLYLHCKGGIKSHKAVERLKEMGFEKIYELKGGFDNFSEEKQAEILGK